MMKTKLLLFMGIVITVMLYTAYKLTNFQYQYTDMENIWDPFEANRHLVSGLRYLPRGIIAKNSDLEMKPLWYHDGSATTRHLGPGQFNNLLAVAAGIRQRKNVDLMVRTFMRENFTIVLFHYDDSLDSWMRDFEWSERVIHITAQNQTKWWFAKRFLHPDVVSIYDYIFLWDEDLGVANFHPRKYLKIVRREGFEISQPALDLNSSIVHHKITLKRRTRQVHSRVHEKRGSLKCNLESEGPPCTGFVEGMAPVFSKAAWYCVWHLIQNDLVHGWGIDMKLGYCSQGNNRTEKVGIVDKEFVLHEGIQTLGTAKSVRASRKQGGYTNEKNSEPNKKDSESRAKDRASRKHGGHTNEKNNEPNKKDSESSEKDPDIRMEIRKQSLWESQKFKDRWENAIKEDKLWTDPFKRHATFKVWQRRFR